MQDKHIKKSNWNKNSIGSGSKKKEKKGQDSFEFRTRPYTKFLLCWRLSLSRLNAYGLTQCNPLDKERFMEMAKATKEWTQNWLNSINLLAHQVADFYYCFYKLPHYASYNLQSHLTLECDCFLESRIYNKLPISIYFHVWLEKVYGLSNGKYFI